MCCCQGNYDAYVKTRQELEDHQMKRYQWERDQMQHMKVTSLPSPPPPLPSFSSLPSPSSPSFFSLPLLPLCVASTTEHHNVLAFPPSLPPPLSLSLSQDYIARFGHGSAKLARQAQSKEKVLAKMVAGGLTEKVVADKVWSEERK